MNALLKHLALFFNTLILSYAYLQAQGLHTDLSKLMPTGWRWSAYADLYYAYDANRPAAGLVGSQLTHPAYHNQLSPSLVYLQAEVEQQHWRAVAALATGSYMAVNYASEPEWARYILQAYGGVRLLPTLWVDAGVLPSFLGYESAISAENVVYSRSFIAEITPYYEAGVRLSYKPSERWQLIASFLNGWQRIVDNNEAKAFSAQVQFFASDALQLSYATFLGDEVIDAPLRLWVHNPWISWQSNKVGVVLEGLYARARHFLQGWQTVWSLQCTAHYNFSAMWQLNTRLEHVSDKSRIFYQPLLADAFEVSSLTMGLLFLAAEPVKIRLESRFFLASDALYEHADNSFRDRSVLFSGGMSFSF